MSTQEIRKTYPVAPFEVAESQLCQELQAYYKAIQSYPDHFARERLTFQKHLLNVICSVQENRSAG